MFVPRSKPARERRRLPKLGGEQGGIGKWLAAIVEILDEANAKLDLVLSGLQSDRVGVVIAGVREYDQALATLDSSTRAGLLRNAIQSFNTGKEQILRNMQAVLRRGERERVLTDRAWKLLFIDKPAVDLRRHLMKNEALVAESLYYMNVATAYLLAAFEHLGEPDGARLVVKQFEQDHAALRTTVFDRAAYFPVTDTSDGILSTEEAYDRILSQAAPPTRLPVR